MRRARDPDDLRVKVNNGRIFIWWNYDEGVSGTLSLSLDAAQSFALGIESEVLMETLKEESKNGNGTSTE